MNGKNDAEPKSVQTQNNGGNEGGKKPSDFVVGSVTFALFLVFMTLWMYFYS